MRRDRQRETVVTSLGPLERVKGTIQQIHRKYTELADEAARAGDRVLAESYRQFAEHYCRMQADA